MDAKIKNEPVDGRVGKIVARLNIRPSKRNSKKEQLAHVTKHDRPDKSNGTMSKAGRTGSLL